MGDQIDFLHVQPWLVDSAWDRILPGLRLAIENSRSETGEEAILEMLRTERAHLYLAAMGGNQYAGFSIVEFPTNDRGVWIHGIHSYSVPEVAAKHDVWGAGVRFFDQMAASFGFLGFRFLSLRDGYERRCPKYGFQKGFVEWVLPVGTLLPREPKKSDGEKKEGES